MTRGAAPQGSLELPDLDGEPAVLGAAATVPAGPRHRGRRIRPRSAPEPVTPRHPAPAGDEEVLLDDVDGEVHVYEPHAATMPPLRPYLRGLWERRPFMVALAKAEVRGKSSSTVLGSLWSILDPVFHAAVYYLLFTIIREGGRPADFLHVLVACIFLFQLTMAAMNDGGDSIRRSKRLLLHSSFPRAMLPLTSIWKGLLQFAPTVGVYAVLHVALGAPTTRNLLLLPVLFVIQIVMMVGIALLTSTLVVLVRDAKNVLNYVTRLLLFTTPIIYPLAVLPDDVRRILAWQPLFPLFASYQQILSGSAPSAGTVLQAAVWAAVLLVAGIQVFLRHERGFALHL